MSQIQRTFPGFFLCCTYAICILSLLFPPALFAQESDGAADGILLQEKIASNQWPSFFTATFPETSQSYEYYKQADGSLFYRSADSSQVGSVPASAINGINITSVTESGGNFASTFTLPDGLGATLTYQYFGAWNATTGFATGTLVLPDGSQRILELNIPAGTTTLAITKAVVIIIVIGAGAIAGIGCLWHALVTDCAADCAAACAKGGGSLKSSSEGWCGRCTCKCYEPRCPQQKANAVPIETCQVFNALAVPVSAFAN